MKVWGLGFPQARRPGGELRGEVRPEPLDCRKGPCGQLVYTLAFKAVPT